MKIAIVTGASSGLGRAFVRQLDREGGLDEIWGVARRAGRMEELAAELNTPMRALALDLVKPESIGALKDRMEEEQPDVRVLINAAGFGKFGTYADMTLPETSDMIDLNCKAAANLTATVIPHMGRGGRVRRSAPLRPSSPCLASMCTLPPKPSCSTTAEPCDGRWPRGASALQRCAQGGSRPSL